MKPIGKDVFQGWDTGLPAICGQFQLDLSSLLDGELGEVAGARAMLHLETCDGCREFFEDTRSCLKLHRDMNDPDRLMARLSMLTGTDFDEQAKQIELVHQLATIFYQLGKAYVLAALDPGYRTRVFEEAVPLESTRVHGHGFVEDVLGDGDERLGGVDWRHARSMLNGRLAQIDTPLEKGRRLLQEAVEADPSHEEAQLYLAFVLTREGKRLKAAEEYRRIFRTAIDETNRAHACVQLGILHAAEESYREAIACFRWVTMTGLAEREPRFFFVRFNIGMDWAHLGRADRSVRAFRDLLDRHPERVSDVIDMFERSPQLRETIESDPDFARALVATCPELFAPHAADEMEPGSGQAADD